jgi:LAGLIDADG endonuclease
MNPHGLKESIYPRVIPSFNFSRNIKELVILELLASYFEANSYFRYDKKRVDVNVYGLYKLESIVNIFIRFPLSNCKQREFIIWAEIVNKLIVISKVPKTYRLSLYKYLPLFLSLVQKLNDIRI